MLEGQLQIGLFAINVFVPEFSVVYPLTSYELFPTYRTFVTLNATDKTAFFTKFFTAVKALFLFITFD